MNAPMAETCKCSRPAAVPPSRRDMLRNFASGFGMLGLASLFERGARADDPMAALNLLALKAPHFGRRPSA